MMFRISHAAASGLLTAALAVVASGCGQRADKKDHAATPVAQRQADDKKAHDHSGWWCEEHGVPEAECSMCSAKMAAEFKKKGDWCDKHDRAMSQCFICNPDRWPQSAQRYEARYGKPPPVPEENRAKKENN